MSMRLVVAVGAALFFLTGCGVTEGLAAPPALDDGSVVERFVSTSGDADESRPVAEPDGTAPKAFSGHDVEHLPEDEGGGGSIPISCSSRDGKMDCYFTSGGCCRNDTRCWNC